MIDIIGFDHIFITVSDLARAEAFYDRVMPVFGFRKSCFAISSESHIQYYNRRFGYVLRPSRSAAVHDPYSPGLHHLCFRVDSVADVVASANALRAAGVDATEAALHSDYASDYWATFFNDPDGVRLEITNYRQERRERHDHWDRMAGAAGGTPVSQVG